MLELRNKKKKTENKRRKKSEREEIAKIGKEARK